jgi:hypothetical protein
VPPECLRRPAGRGRRPTVAAVPPPGGFGRLRLERRQAGLRCLRTGRMSPGRGQVSSRPLTVSAHRTLRTCGLVGRPDAGTPQDPAYSNCPGPDGHPSRDRGDQRCRGPEPAPCRDHSRCPASSRRSSCGRPTNGAREPPRSADARAPRPGAAGFVGQPTDETAVHFTSRADGSRRGCRSAKRRAGCSGPTPMCTPLRRRPWARRDVELAKSGQGLARPAEPCGTSSPAPCLVRPDMPALRLGTHDDHPHATYREAAERQPVQTAGETPRGRETDRPPVAARLHTIASSIPHDGKPSGEERCRTSINSAS